MTAKQRYPALISCLLLSLLLSNHAKCDQNEASKVLAGWKQLRTASQSGSVQWILKENEQTQRFEAKQLGGNKLVQMDLTGGQGRSKIYGSNDSYSFYIDRDSEHRPWVLRKLATPSFYDTQFSRFTCYFSSLHCICEEDLLPHLENGKLQNLKFQNRSDSLVQASFDFDFTARQGGMTHAEAMLDPSSHFAIQSFQATARDQEGEVSFRGENKYKSDDGRILPTYCTYTIAGSKVECTDFQWNFKPSRETDFRLANFSLPEPKYPSDQPRNEWLKNVATYGLLTIAAVAILISVFRRSFSR